jgi:hypothetical protein
MLFETLKYAPFTVFSLEIVSKNLQQKLVGDLDYYRKFVDEIWRLSTTGTEASVLEIKLMIYRVTRMRIYHFNDSSKTMQILNVETEGLETFEVDPPAMFSEAAAWCCWKDGIIYTGGRVDGNRYTNLTWFYQIATKSFTELPGMISNRGG